MPMAPYSVFPRPKPPQRPDLTRPPATPPRAQSRFVEGSMSDRISRTPPLDFLGPEDVARYERQFYSASPSPPRPRSSGGQPLKKVSNRFFGPLWEGVREKLRLTRSKSASSITSNKHKDPVSRPLGQDNFCRPTAKPSGGATPAPGTYPSREEVMQSYKSLMDSGFFTSHAIQGTRHPLRPLSSPAVPTRAPPPPPPQTKSFSEHLAQAQLQRPRPAPLSSHPALGFSSVPYSAAGPSFTSNAPPLDSPTFSITVTSPPSGNGPRSAAPAPPPLRRGTKRDVALIAGGPVDREEASETGARKLAKKLRKSASRVSADLPLAVSHRSVRTSSGSSSNSISPPQTATTNPSPFEHGPPPSRQSITATRSFSSSWKSGGASSDERLGAVPKKLSKAKRAAMAASGRRRERGPGGSPRAYYSRPATPPRQLPSVFPASRPLYSSGCGTPDPMALDPPPATRYSPSYLSSAAAYPPPRPRGGPLSIVPDVNQGIPTVPTIPAQFKHGKEEKAFSALHDSAISNAENVESCEVW